VDQDEYHRLHGELTRLCREGVGSRDATEQALFRQVEEILRPWVTLDSLDWADREIVCKLRDQCQQVQQVLEGRPAARGNPRAPALVWLGAGLLVAACLVILVVWGADPRSWPWVLAIGRWFHGARLAVVRSSFEQRLLMGGGCVTAVIIVVVWLGARGR
jgi:hypothetical protein